MNRRLTMVTKDNADLGLASPEVAAELHELVANVERLTRELEEARNANMAKIAPFLPPMATGSTVAADTPAPMTYREVDAYAERLVHTLAGLCSAAGIACNHYKTTSSDEAMILLAKMVWEAEDALGAHTETAEDRAMLADGVVPAHLASPQGSPAQNCSECGGSGIRDVTINWCRACNSTGKAKSEGRES